MKDGVHIHWWERDKWENQDKVRENDLQVIDVDYFSTQFHEDCLSLCEKTWDEQWYLLKGISSYSADVLPMHCRDDVKICQKLENMARDLANEINWMVAEECESRWQELLKEGGYYELQYEEWLLLLDADYEMRYVQEDIRRDLWESVFFSRDLLEKWAQITPYETQSLEDEELRVSLILLGFICHFYEAPFYVYRMVALRDELLELQTMRLVLKRLDLHRTELTDVFSAFELLESIAEERKRKMYENNQRTQKARESAKRKRHILKLDLMIGVHDYLKTTTHKTKTQINRELQERFLGVSANHPADDAGRRLRKDYGLWSLLISELKTSSFDANKFYVDEADEMKKNRMNKETFLGVVRVIQCEHFLELEKSGKLIEF